MLPIVKPIASLLCSKSKSYIYVHIWKLLIFHLSACFSGHNLYNFVNTTIYKKLLIFILNINFFYICIE